MADRPVIRCLVAYPVPDGSFVVWCVPVSLELAAESKTLGWQVLVDPASEIDLATWERVQRWCR